MLPFSRNPRISCCFLFSMVVLNDRWRFAVGNPCASLICNSRILHMGQGRFTCLRMSIVCSHMNWGLHAFVTGLHENPWCTSYLWKWCNGLSLYDMINYKMKHDTWYVINHTWYVIIDSCYIYIYINDEWDMVNAMTWYDMCLYACCKSV